MGYVDREMEVQVVSMNIVKPAVSIAAAPGTTITPGTMVTFTAAPANCSTPAYQWQRNGVNVPGATLATFSSATLADNDVISVKMQCADTCFVETQGNELTMHINTGIGNVSLNAISIHPNPGAGEFTLTGYVAAKETSLEVMNMAGQVVYAENNITTAGGYIGHRLNIGNVGNGIYLLRVKTKDKVFTQRLTIQR